MVEDLEGLIDTYKERKDEIRRRLREFDEILDESDERVFADLCFCICTPQSKATTCWKAITSLSEKNLLMDGDEEQIAKYLEGVRFNDAKARYIISARNFFKKDETLELKKRLLAFRDVFELREWLVRNVMGLGYKEASHFLRNIGLGRGLAILDRHILKNLKKYGVIDEIPKVLTKKAYLEIEEKLKAFSGRIGVSMGELDLLLWSQETGMVFK